MTKTTIDDLVKNQKSARNNAMISGFSSLVWYGNSAFQYFSEEGNGKAAAIAYVLVWTLCAINAAVNYKTYRDYKEQQL